MIKINCETKDTLKLTDMKFFQGNLKKRTSQDLSELKASLLSEGLMMPFAIWKHDKENLLLDGHGRRQVLLDMLDDEPELLQIEWPVIYVQAETEDDARKALLQITSSYGKVTKSGYKQFCVSIPDYKAPAISKFVSKLTKPDAKENQAQKQTANGKTVIKIRVSSDKMAQVLEIFKQFDFIEVL